MNCGFCTSPSVLSANAVKVLQLKEQEISRVYHNSRINLYVLKHEELIYSTEPLSFLVNDVTHSDVKDMILRLKHSTKRFGTSYDNNITTQLPIWRKDCCQKVFT